MKNLGAILLCTAFFVANFGFSQTGTQADKLKELKIKENPVDYLKQGGQMQDIPEFNSKTEKQNWFKERKINTEKTNSLSNLTDPPKNTIIILPSVQGFPSYTITGDNMLDEQNYASKKSNWIANNPSKYKQLSTPTNTTKSENEKKERFMNTN